MHIAWVMGVPVAMYLADYAYGFFARTHLIERSQFTRLETGVELTFSHPEGFKSDGTGYVLVCVPWVSRWQWHAFSLFAHPTKPNTSSVFMCKAGDWTTELHRAVQRPTTRPVCVSFPVHPKILEPF